MLHAIGMLWWPLTTHHSPSPRLFICHGLAYPWIPVHHQLPNPEEWTHTLLQYCIHTYMARGLQCEYVYTCTTRVSVFEYTVYYRYSYTRNIAICTWTTPLTRHLHGQSNRTRPREHILIVTNNTYVHTCYRYRY